MNTATIYFSDSSILTVHENDLITPVHFYTDSEGQIIIGKSEPFELFNHVHAGLVPSILSAFSKGGFFYLNEKHDTIYNSSAVTRITVS